MVKGVFRQWKKPLAYYFVNSTLDAQFLKNAITNIIKELQKIGLIVIIVSTDMGGNFMQLANLLGATSDSPFFVVNNQKTFYLFDPSHVIKACRNNFQNDDISANSKLISPLFIKDYQQRSVNNNFISYKYVKQIYELDKVNPNRLTKLTDIHVNPNNFQKVKVRYCVQLLSARVASAI